MCGDPTTIDGVNTEADGHDPDYTAYQQGGIQVSFTADPESNCDHLQYDWDFGDGSVHSSEQNPNHLYAQTGVYEVTVTVTCADCGNISFSSTLTVNVMQITFDNPCTDQSTCDISDIPSMPGLNLVAHVIGVDPDPTDSTTFHWTVKRQIDVSTCNSKLPIIIPTSDFTQDTQGGHFAPVFPNIFGGDLSFQAQATINGVQITGSSKDDPALANLHIRGTNPSKSAVQTALPHEALQQIACRESSIDGLSGQRQFEAAAGQASRCPIVAHNGDGGTGMMQITPGTEGDLWNWRANVSDGINIFNTQFKFSVAYDADGGVVRSELPQMLINLNSARQAQNLPPVVSLSLRHWTSTGFSPPGNYGELELDGIRGYNGFNGTDGFGHSLHEFKVNQTAGQVPIVIIDPKTMIGMADWSEVNFSQRPKGGDPNYVNHVTDLHPTCP